MTQEQDIRKAKLKIQGLENSPIRKLIPERKPINAMNVESPSARSLSS
uniref:Zinc finger protein 25 n=1 Tax=Rousettus aegyptiacus TaxID=9407 RepID=A0A7J8GIA8_ROUAE|nr:zinc finger protein 25 [Rousettus aegyptiacus]